MREGPSAQAGRAPGVPDGSPWSHGPGDRTESPRNPQGAESGPRAPFPLARDCDCDSDSAGKAFLKIFLSQGRESAQVLFGEMSRRQISPCCGASEDRARRGAGTRVPRTGRGAGRGGCGPSQAPGDRRPPGCVCSPHGTRGLRRGRGADGGAPRAGGLPLSLSRGPRRGQARPERPPPPRLTASLKSLVKTAQGGPQAPARPRAGGRDPVPARPPAPRTFGA